MGKFRRSFAPLTVALSLTIAATPRAQESAPDA